MLPPPVYRNEETCSIRDKEEAQLFKNFKSIFSCSICLNYVNTPRMTPCGHMFCSDCLHCWVQSIYPQTHCPCCRESFKLEDTILMYNGHSTKSTVRLRSNLKKKFSFKNKAFHGYRFCNILLYEMNFSESLSIISVTAIAICFTAVTYSLYLIVK